MGGITRKPDTQSGRYCIAGTRIPVSAVKSFWNAGYNIEEIMAEYPTLTFEQIYCAISFRSPTPGDG